MNPRIELIYSWDCPNVDTARRRLRAALAELGASPNWVEWERSSPDAPEYARRYGSPTVLIDGFDVDGEEGAEVREACRLYVDGDGKLGAAPSTEAIKSALRLAFSKEVV